MSQGKTKKLTMKIIIMFNMIIILFFSFCSSSSTTSNNMIENLKNKKIEDVSQLILFGSDHRCSKDEECESGLCNYGICIGYLLSTNFYMRRNMKIKILEIIQNLPILKNQIIKDIKTILSNNNHDPYLIGRSLLLLAVLDSKNQNFSTPIEIKKAMTSNNDVIRFFSVLALCQLKNYDTIEVIEEFVNHESEAVKALAVNCRM